MIEYIGKRLMGFEVCYIPCVADHCLKKPQGVMEMTG